jgi:hypothetical protein
MYLLSNILSKFNAYMYISPSPSPGPLFTRHLTHHGLAEQGCIAIYNLCFSAVNKARFNSYGIVDVLKSVLATHRGSTTSALRLGERYCCSPLNNNNTLKLKQPQDTIGELKKDKNERIVKARSDDHMPSTEAIPSTILEDDNAASSSSPSWFLINKAYYENLSNNSEKYRFKSSGAVVEATRTLEIFGVYNSCPVM